MARSASWSNWPNRASRVIDMYCQEAGLTHGELGFRYFELGGMCAGFELEGILFGVRATSAYDHDIIALAINERLVELGGRHSVPYRIRLTDLL
jgi:hypothetical protein